MKTNQVSQEIEQYIRKLGYPSRIRCNIVITNDDYNKIKTDERDAAKALETLLSCQDSFMWRNLDYRKKLIEIFKKYCSDRQFSKTEVLMRNLEKLSKCAIKQYIEEISIQKGMQDKFIQTKQAEIERRTTYIGVKEFAKLVNRHPNTIRSDFHRNKIIGKQTSKGILILYSEKDKY